MPLGKDDWLKDSFVVNHGSGPAGLQANTFCANRIINETLSKMDTPILVVAFFIIFSVANYGLLLKPRQKLFLFWKICIL